MVKRVGPCARTRACHLFVSKYAAEVKIVKNYHPRMRFEHRKHVAVERTVPELIENLVIVASVFQEPGDRTQWQMGKFWGQHRLSLLDYQIDVEISHQRREQLRGVIRNTAAFGRQR